MRALILTRTPTQGGRVLETRREAATDTLRVGRHAACEVLLADPQVALDQGVIVDRNGLVYLEGAGVTPGGSGGLAMRTVPLRPGEAVEVGPFRLRAEAAPEGFDACLVAERLRPPADEPAGLRERSRRLTLRATRLPKRSAAWALFALAIVVFLALPAARVLGLPWQGTPVPAVASDAFWNPGPVLLAHQPIEAECEACHRAPFERVPDAACLECHRDIGHHVAQSLKPAALFGGMRCAECHRDHKGARATYHDDDRFCVDCHRDIQARAPGVGSQNVADFAREHPAFRLTLPAERGKPAQRVRQGKPPIEHASGLIFPHDVHLDPGGVKHPGRGTVTLECNACHQPDSGKRTFEPVSMARHCQECHKLEVEPAVTTRQLPHAAPSEVRIAVQEFYANLALNGVKDSFEKAFGVPGEGILRRVGEPTTEARRNALALANRKAEQVTEELFEIRACRTCHELVREDTPAGRQWNVTRVLQGHTWMPHARFNHQAHTQSACADCHDVAQSKRSADVAMPDIASCRDCHAGAKPEAKRVTSNCMLCHGFHEQAHAWDPTFKPRNPSPHPATARRAP